MSHLTFQRNIREEPSHFPLYSPTQNGSGKKHRPTDRQDENKKETERNSSFFHQYATYVATEGDPILFYFIVYA